jgi:hypothetical protein
MLTLFGGKVHDLEALLIEERLLDGWEPKVRSRMGLTIGAFNTTVFKVEFGIPKDPVVLAKLTSDAEVAQQAGTGVEESVVVVTGADARG